jgi:hypothetical protein
MPGPTARPANPRALVLHASNVVAKQEALLRVVLGVLALGCAVWLLLLPGRITKLLALCAVPLSWLVLRRGLGMLRTSTVHARL